MRVRSSTAGMIGAIPALPRSIHFLGICGRMVGGLALALRDMGVRVTGTDAFQFPPMPDILRDAGIRVNKSWSARNLPPRVDAIVTGALLNRSGAKGNPELEAAMKSGVPIWNSTAFLEHYFLRRSCNHVVAGTKGKTTTTAMLLWIFHLSNLSPDFMIGGQVRDTIPRVRLSGAPVMVLEGDEFYCGLGDPQPKFLRYHPKHLIVTNLFHDHIEIFPTSSLYRRAFVHLVNQVPGNGSITLNADDEGAMSLADLTPTPMESVGFSRKATKRITGFRETRKGMMFRLGGVTFRLDLHGRMNATDAAMAAVAARNAGISLRKSAIALRDFPGVEGRMEIIGQFGRTLIYVDEASHPRTVKPLLDAVRKRHPRGRIIFIFEPRYTGGRDGVCQKELPDVLSNADVVLACRAAEVMRFEKKFSHRILCRELRKRGVQAVACKKIENIVDRARQLVRDGDIVIVSFALIHAELTQKLVWALGADKKTK